MKNRYVQLWLVLFFLLLIFPPAHTGGLYEGHMFIAEIGKFQSRPRGGYIEGEIVWSRLLFEAVIATVFIVLLKAFSVLESLSNFKSKGSNQFHARQIGLRFSLVLRVFVIPVVLTIFGLYLVNLSLSGLIGAWGYIGLIAFLSGGVSLLSNYQKIRAILNQDMHE